MISKEEKEALLRRIKETYLTEEHLQELKKRVQAENDSYERIVKAQTLTSEEWHKPFDI